MPGVAGPSSTRSSLMQRLSIILSSCANQLLMEREQIPQSAKAVYKILNSMGIEESDPRVVHQLVEFIHSKGL